MLTEYLQNEHPHVQTNRSSIAPGVQVCFFTVQQPEDGFPVTIPVSLTPMQYEILFNFDGIFMLGQEHGEPIRVMKEELFLLSDVTSIKSANILSEFHGVLLTVNEKNPQNSRDALCNLSGKSDFRIEQLKNLFTKHSGFILLKNNPWSQLFFSMIRDVAPKDQAYFCLFKSIELLFLLSSHNPVIEKGLFTETKDSYLTQAVSSIKNYMEKHLDEKLTIQLMSSQFHISPTAFKSCFKRLYGEPVHTWLQTYRMTKAAEYLVTSPLTILEIAQSVGYEGVSQFNILFKRHYGLTPGQYRKMSISGNL